MSHVLVIGGTGLLGYHTVLELVRRGHKVTSLSLPATDSDPELPAGVSIVEGDVNKFADDELTGLLVGVDAVCYAAGADERTTPHAPAARFFYEANVLPTQRLARLSRDAGVQKLVIFGSYTAEFADRWPDLGYREHNGYPRARLAQEEVAYFEGAGVMDVMVLRLPYIFGLAGGRRPLWQFVIDTVQAQPGQVVVPAGSTAAVTVRQVAEAAVGAVERGRHGARYAISEYELSYVELHQIACRVLGRDPRDVVAAPLESWISTFEGHDASLAAQGLEHGVHMVDTARFQSRPATVDAVAVHRELGINPADVPAAVEESLRWCVDHPQ